MKINARAIAYLNGVMLGWMAVALLIPLIYDLSFCSAKNIWLFIPSIVVCLFIGISIILSCRVDSKLNFSRHDMYLIVICFWIVFAFFSSFPFYLYSDYRIDFISSLFEATSGITATGATIYSDVESLPESLLLWRFILMFIGGIGIVSIAIIAFPLMKVGGMQLFQTENSDKSGKILPRSSQLLLFLLIAYVAIISIFVVLLNLSGMSPFDSICHGISAVATGGFSTKNEGIAAFNSMQIDLIIGCAMLIGGLTFLELVNLFKNGLQVFYKNQQTRFYIKFVFVTVFLLTMFSFINNENNISVKTAVNVFFAIVSGITTSAFTLTDYAYHSQFFKVLLFLLPMIGACSGSSSGGIKLFRIQIIWEIIKTHMKKIIDPNYVVVPKYHNNAIEQNLMISVVVFVVLFVFSFAVSVVLICSLGEYDIGTSTVVVGACLFNAGFPLDFLATTTDSYFSMNTCSKVILMVDMLVGRLEVIPIFMVCTSMFWKKNQN